MANVSTLKVKLLAGWIILTTNLLLVAYAASLFVRRVAFSSSEEFTTFLSLTTPILAAHASAFISYVVRTAGGDADARATTTSTFAAIAIAFPMLLGVSLAVGLYSFQHFSLSFSGLKLMVGVAETTFGVYIGQFVTYLYHNSGQPEK